MSFQANLFHYTFLNKLFCIELFHNSYKIKCRVIHESICFPFGCLVLFIKDMKKASTQFSVFVAVFMAMLAMGSGALAGEKAAGKELSKVIRRARPGQKLNVSELTLSNKTTATLDMKRVSKPGVKFLLSDMPEYFRTGNGIAMQERVSKGTVRLYTYHVPTPDAPKKKITAVIENLGTKPMKFKFTRYAFPKPGGFYQKLAKEGMHDFLSGKVPFKGIRKVNPGDRMVIDPQMDKYVTKKDDLVHGWYEFEISEGSRITVFQCDPKDNSLTVIDNLPKLPRKFKDHKRDGAGRGLFEEVDFDVTPADEKYVFDTAEGIKQILVADGKRDPWITGYDHIQDRRDVNKGNYGCLYNIKLKWKSSDGKGVALVAYTSKGSGKWCRKRSMVVKVNHGMSKGGIIDVPSKEVLWDEYPEAVLIQKYAPKAKDKVQTIELQFTPPGASCLPIPFALIPFDVR